MGHDETLDPLFEQCANDPSCHFGSFPFIGCGGRFVKADEAVRNNVIRSWFIRTSSSSIFPLVIDASSSRL